MPANQLPSQPSSHEADALTPTFEEIAAIVSTASGDAAAVAFRLESGSYDISDPTSVPGVRRGERITTYLTTEDDYIVRIEPDGHTTLLDLDTGEVTPHGYLGSGRVKNGKVFRASEWIGPVNDALSANMELGSFSTDGRVSAVLVVTERPAKNKDIPTNDTPMIFSTWSDSAPGSNQSTLGDSFSEEGASHEPNPKRASMARRTIDTDKSNDPPRHYEALKRVPGVDPVLAAIDGRQESIPQAGYWIRADIAAAEGGGVIEIIRYQQGSLELSGLDDSRSAYGSASVYVNFNGYGSHIVAVEPPAFGGRNVEPYDRGRFAYTGLSFADTELIDLRNGGRLLDQEASLILHGGGLGFSAAYRDIEHSQGGYGIELERVTSDEKELQHILAHLGRVMGLDATDAATLANTVNTKLGYNSVMSAAEVAELLATASAEAEAPKDQPTSLQVAANFILKLLKIK